jgi:protein-S-isoprenylcysteine O-methyltransferase Ste14
MSHRKGLGSEHPINDKGQAIFLFVYLGVWGLDSFIFHFSAVFADVVPIFIRLPLGILSLVFGIYLIAKSEAAVFGRTLVGRTSKPEFITSGVYAWVRHPMYLGSLLFLLAFFLTTFSLLSLLVWIGLFLFYDRMATYEERDLISIVGEQYLNYQKQVPKWLMRIRRI